MKKKILLIDHSGRGHSIADLFVRTNKEVMVYYVSGSEYIQHDRIVFIPNLSMDNIDGLVNLVQKEDIDFVFVANTAALAKGYVDRFNSENIQVIGPTKKASRLEYSKVFAKELCTKYNIPVAKFEVYNNAIDAKKYISEIPYNVVVKADGLCGGNGSYVCNSRDEAYTAIDKIMVDKIHGDAGNNIVIEEKLDGIELSFFILFDGKDFKILPMALDYKRSDDGNVGVNGGGMGSFSPHPLEGEEINEILNKEILHPLKKCIEEEKLDYTGIIYVGAMFNKDGLFVLEFNIRFGDPEAEVVLPRIENDFVEVCQAILDKRLSEIDLNINSNYFCNVVATQGRTKQISKGKNKGWYKGWPYGRYGKGYKITGMEDINSEECKVFIGESIMKNSELVSDGGRVIHIVGFGKSKHIAQQNAYKNIELIKFDGVRYRKDIGHIYNDDIEISEKEIKSFLNLYKNK